MLNGMKGFSLFPERRGVGDPLLCISEKNQGRFVSGEEAGRRMGTSRAAVWKRDGILRRRGFGIEGAPVWPNTIEPGLSHRRPPS